MSLASLKAWLRRDSARGLDVMRRNRSFVFFQLVEDFAPDLGPVAGAWGPLMPLTSIASTDTVWAYGLPFWIDAAVPWIDADYSAARRSPKTPGLAIVGRTPTSSSAAAATAAGARAGAIRHPAEFVVLCREGRAVKETPPASATFAAPERRGDRALDRGRALCRTAAGRGPADAVESREGRPAPCPASEHRRASSRPAGEALGPAAGADRTAAQA